MPCYGCRQDMVCNPGIASKDRFPWSRCSSEGPTILAAYPMTCLGSASLQEDGIALAAHPSPGVHGPSSCSAIRSAAASVLPAPQGAASHTLHLLVVVDIEWSDCAAGTTGAGDARSSRGRLARPRRGRVDRLTTRNDIVPIVSVAGWVVTCDLTPASSNARASSLRRLSSCMIIIQGQDEVAHTGCRERLQRLHKLRPIRGRVEDDVPGIVSRQELRIGQGRKQAFTDNTGRRVWRQWGQGEMFVMPPRRDFLPPCVDRTDRPEFVVPGAGGPGQIRLSVIRRFLQEPETLHDGAVDAPGG